MSGDRIRDRTAALVVAGLLAVLGIAPGAAGQCPAEGSCFIVHYTPGCDDVVCCEAVCEIEFFCCAAAWDGYCVDLATQVCTVCPAPGSCGIFHPTPGCNDEDCCNAVCAVEPLCCQTEWSTTCINIAEDLCDLCVGDTNDDGEVDVDDLVQVITDWGCMNPPGPCAGDVDGDGDVDVSDIIFVILGWGPCG